MNHTQDRADSRGDVTIHGEPWPSARQAWIGVVLLMLAYAFSYIDRSILALVVQPIKVSLRLSDTQIGLLQGPAFGLLFTLTTVPFGWLADAVNRTRLIAAAIAVWSVMTSVCGLSTNFAQLFVARMGVAVGEAALSPSAPSLMADYFPPERRTLPLSLYIVAGGAGTGIALIAGGLVATLIRGHKLVTVLGFGPFEPWQIIFFTLSAPGILVSAMFLLLPEPRRRDRGHAEATLGELGRVLRSRRAILIPQAAGICLFQLQAFAFQAWLPAFFMRMHDWSMADVGLKYGPVQVLMGALGGLSGGWVARMLVSNTWLSLALLGLMAFCGHAPSGASLASIQEIVPNRLRGRVTAFYYAALGLISMTMGPLIIGLMNDYLFVSDRRIGVSIAIVSALALPTGAALLLIAGRRRCDIAWVG